MIKIFFIVVIAMLVLAMVSGMDILRGKKFVDGKKMAMEKDYIEYARAAKAISPDSGGDVVSIRQKYARSVPILLYHGIITDNNWEEDGTNISLKNFQDQMFALKRAGYQTITMADFADYIREKKNLPDKSIMITFDDGRKDSYYQSDPLFRALGYNAVMFLISGRSLGENSAGNNFYLGKSQLEDMIESGRWEIQSHGDFDHDWMMIDGNGKTGHFLSNRLWLPDQNRIETDGEAKTRILADLENSKEKIERELGMEVVSFAYPFNDFGQMSENFPDARNFIAENITKIYPLTMYQEELSEPVVNMPDPNSFMIKRINVDDSLNSRDLLDILSQNREKPLPYQDSFWANNGWRNKWGASHVWGDLNLTESEEKGGNMTVLMGTSLWRDYSVRSLVNVTDGDSVSQTVRYRNSENYGVCNFETDEISISEKVHGRRSVLASQAGDYSKLASSDNEIGADVEAGYVSCFFNGQKMLSAKLDNSLDTGGIGYYAWDDLPGSLNIRIKKVAVEPAGQPSWYNSNANANNTPHAAGTKYFETPFPKRN